MNRLSQETSPYLKQHENNPVDWYPWGEEAFKKAKEEDKPILLSIGYSACHWCHVMAHESFENVETAKLMNEHFVNIKVDREERPDLDQIYQNVAQLLTRSGGWPLTVFLTPDLKPFFGGTYFPPEDRYGRVGFPQVLVSLSNAYHSQRSDVLENTQKLMNAIAELENESTEENKNPNSESLKKIFQNIVSWMDWKNGGFGGAPKFPNTMNLSYLWRFFLATGTGMAEEAVLFSLEKMAKSGLYDQLGGGFHRYSVDAAFSVPHFEKMLYDNALLIKLYSEVICTSENLSSDLKKLFQNTITHTFEYLEREMKNKDGGYFSAQDADSEGHEGKFFVWNRQDLKAVLSNEADLNFFCERLGVTEDGNFEESGKTVLYQARVLMSDEEKQRLESLKEKVLQFRIQNRIAPSLDHKILTAWNGLLISGLCFASKAFEKLNDSSWSNKALSAALEAYAFLKAQMTKNKETLFSVYAAHKPHEKGAARGDAFLDDYCFLAMAALDLSRSTKDPVQAEGFISDAKTWMQTVIENFSDSTNGGFFFTSTFHEKLIQRPKTLFDQAIPSGNAVAIECLLILAELCPDKSTSFNSIARENLARFFPKLEAQSFGMGELALSAMLATLGGVAVSGEKATSLCQHAHVFQKPETTSSGYLVCSHQTCRGPFDSLEKAQTEIKRALVF